MLPGCPLTSHPWGHLFLPARALPPPIASIFSRTIKSLGLGRLCKGQNDDDPLKYTCVLITDGGKYVTRVARVQFSLGWGLQGAETMIQFQGHLDGFLQSHRAPA